MFNSLILSCLVSLISIGSSFTNIESDDLVVSFDNAVDSTDDVVSDVVFDCVSSSIERSYYAWSSADTFFNYSNLFNFSFNKCFVTDEFSTTTIPALDIGNGNICILLGGYAISSGTVSTVGLRGSRNFGDYSIYFPILSNENGIYNNLSYIFFGVNSFEFINEFYVVCYGTNELTSIGGAGEIANYTCGFTIDYLDYISSNIVFSREFEYHGSLDFSNSTLSYDRYIYNRLFSFSTGNLDYNDSNINICLMRKNDAYETGYSEGYNVGFSTGFDEGVSNAPANRNYTFLSLLGAIADTPVLMIKSLFNFELFGTSMYIAVMSLITGLILLFLVRKFIKL